MNNLPSRKAVKGILAVAITLSACIFYLAAFTSCGQAGFQTAPTKVSNFKGKLVDGEISDYQTQKGNATLIVLTASWCPGCRAELPHLKKLDSEFGDRGLKILLVSEDDTPQIAASYNKSAKISWSTFHWNYEIINALGNPGVIPVSYLVNAQDSIVKINVGGFDEKEMRKLIGKLVTGY